MSFLKIVCSDPKSGRTVQLEVKEDAAAYFINKKIGDIIDGSILDLSGYKLKITGGSDKSGFPMNTSINGTVKTKVLRKSSNKKNAVIKRMMLRGNVISPDIEQINAVVVEYGDKPVDSIFVPKTEKNDASKKDDNKK
ncbi:MAG: 30S ribosomal protein S6e [Candidatus Micrarchaeia archaeon]